jgi:hypothetical protein
MSETTSSSQHATGPIEPVAAHPASEPVAVRERSRLSTIAAWVGIVAGVVFIVAVVFFSGFVLGAHGGRGGGGHHRGGPGMTMNHEGPMMRQGPGFVFPGGPGGPGMQGPGTQSQTPSTTAAPTPPR